MSVVLSLVSSGCISLDSCLVIGARLDKTLLMSILGGQQGYDYAAIRLAPSHIVHSMNIGNIYSLS